MVFPDCLEKKENEATPDFKASVVKLVREGSVGHAVEEVPTVLPASRVTPDSLELPVLRERSDPKDRKDLVVLLDCPDLKATTEKMDHRERLASEDLRVKTETQDQRVLQVSSDHKVKLENRDLWVNRESLVYRECLANREFLAIPARKVKLVLRDHRAKMDHPERKDCLVFRESAE